MLLLLLPAVAEGDALGAAEDVGDSLPVVAAAAAAAAAALALAMVLTISCLVSDDLVPGPGFVRLIFILRPVSPVA